jgi:hypothetical protein
MGNKNNFVFMFGLILALSMVYASEIHEEFWNESEYFFQKSTSNQIPEGSSTSWRLVTPEGVIGDVNSPTGDFLFAEYFYSTHGSIVDDEIVFTYHQELLNDFEWVAMQWSVDSGRWNPFMNLVASGENVTIISDYGEYSGTEQEFNFSWHTTNSSTLFYNNYHPITSGIFPDWAVANVSIATLNLTGHSFNSTLHLQNVTLYFEDNQSLNISIANETNFNDSVSIDLSDAINNQYPNGFSNIPIDIVADGYGYVKIDGFYMEYLRGNQIISPVGDYSSTLIPYKIYAPDMDFCTYWITISTGILHFPNTTISCDNLEENTYVSSKDTDYIFHFYANNSEGESVYLQSNFSTTPNAQIVSVGGGGGGNIIETESPKKESVCLIYYEPLDEAWSQFNEDLTWDSFLIVWETFWDRLLCDSAGSIVPVV